MTIGKNSTGQQIREFPAEGSLKPCRFSPVSARHEWPIAPLREAPLRSMLIVGDDYSGRNRDVIEAGGGSRLSRSCVKNNPFAGAARSLFFCGPLLRIIMPEQEQEMQGKYTGPNES